MFLPTTRQEMEALGWPQLDVILVTGDAYIDSPFIGIAVVGKILLHHGFRVGVIAQPDLRTDFDITRLGEPKLFWGVSGGCIDSMVANRTASGRRRKTDDYTPGGLNNKRPDRAVIAYANLIRQYFKQTVPLVLGGIEASLRRIAHYDYWDNKVRRSILFDAKADYLLYGMADRAVVELARALAAKQSPTAIRGLCYATAVPPPEALVLPPYQVRAANKDAFTSMFRVFYENNDSVTAQILVQQQDNRFLVHNPPQPPLTTPELDAIHALDYARDLHPFYRQSGTVTALETIRFALTTHRGCYGECNFCAIAVHQGRTIQNRSVDSLVSEARVLAAHPAFKGTIADVGGPTANMYGFDCTRKAAKGACRDKRCLFPRICSNLKIDHGAQIALLQRLRAIKNIKKIAVASGIRYDMILADKKNGLAYLREVIRHHVSGQMKIAPEHCNASVLEAMGKPGADILLQFRQLFNRLTQEEGLQQFLTYYLIAAHPGCSLEDMKALRAFAQKELHLLPRQMQLFTPTPSTWSTLMYWTETNPFTHTPCFVEKSSAARERQRAVLAAATPPQKPMASPVRPPRGKKGTR